MEYLWIIENRNLLGPTLARSIALFVAIVCLDIQYCSWVTYLIALCTSLFWEVFVSSYLIRAYATFLEVSSFLLFILVLDTIKYIYYFF